jgi:crotonobetainyl-CoA:carnitine CoA-transferase CaiB-like acyl-CoA transferase
MRSYTPRLGPDSVNFALLNRGKRSIAIDLKAPDALRRLAPLLRRADVLVEQFRPGVMDRLGLGYDALAPLNPRLIYCAITGYGQAGPRAMVAGHDLNYQADTGMLMIAAGSDGAPVIPPALVADLGGGAYPAVINILLALQNRAATGKGCRLDIAMADNLFPFLYWAMGNGLAAGEWPRPGGEQVTGGSPRYHIYRTADDRFVAAAPLEQRFWENFCAAIGLAADHRDDQRDPAATTQAVAAIIRAHAAAHWQRCFAGKDVCATVAVSIAAALEDPHFAARGIFAWGVTAGEARIAAVPVPVAPAFRDRPGEAAAPALGEANAMLAP